MRKVTWLVSVVLLLGVTARAQDTPKAEVFGGYSHMFANLNATSFNLNGFHVSVRENLYSWFGGDLDFSTNYGTEAGFKVNTQSIMYGPVFAYRKHPKVTPFGHVLLGAVRGSDGFEGISKAATKFGIAPGGGIDVKVSDMLSLRLIEADYISTRFLSTRQDNVRISAGLVLTFGKK
jgi:opacity protein-like surface antigen